MNSPKALPNKIVDWFYESAEHLSEEDIEQIALEELEEAKFKKQPKLEVVAAAIKDNGIVYSVPAPARHHDVMKVMKDLGCKRPIDGVQGFLLSDGSFVNRSLAAQVAVRANQCYIKRGELFSEDLW